MNKTLINKSIRFAFTTVVIFLLLYIPVYNNTPHNYTAVKILCSVFFACTLAGILSYIFNAYDKSKYKNFLVAYKWEFGIIISIILMLLPILTQSYFFYDDYWSFAGVKTANVNVSLGRTINALMWFIFPSINASNAYFIRWISVAGLIAFGLCLFKWQSSKSENKPLSFITTICICLLSAIIDGVGYGSTFPFSWGVAFSGFSVIIAERAWKVWRKNRLISTLLYILALISLFGAFNLYQLATPVIFLFLLIKIYNEKEKKRFGFLFAYGLLFCVVIVFYTLSNSFLAAYYKETVSSRGSIINSWNEFTQKLAYFKDIFNKTTDQVAVSFLGNLAFSNVGRINVLLSYKNPDIGLIVRLFIWVISIIPLVRFSIKTRKLLDVVLMLLCIPFSFYCLLVLKESSYVSYYVFPLAATIMFLFINGLSCILDAVKALIKKLCRHEIEFHLNYLLVPVMVLVMLQAYLYVSNFWVDYNRNGYNYVKNSIYPHIDDANWIHIYGVLYPGQGNIYSVFTAQRALEELNVDPNQYKITTSDNPYYIAIIQQQDYDNMKAMLSPEEMEYLDSIYLFDDVYARYYLSRNDFTHDELIKLKQIFNKAGIIPSDNNDAIIINLSWVSNT